MDGVSAGLCEDEGEEVTDSVKKLLDDIYWNIRKEHHPKAFYAVDLSDALDDVDRLKSSYEILLDALGQLAFNSRPRESVDSNDDAWKKIADVLGVTIEEISERVNVQ